MKTTQPTARLHDLKKAFLALRQQQKESMKKRPSEDMILNFTKNDVVDFREKIEVCFFIKSGASRKYILILEDFPCNSAIVWVGSLL